MSELLIFRLFNVLFLLVLVLVADWKKISSLTFTISLLNILIVTLFIFTWPSDIEYLYVLHFNVYRYVISFDISIFSCYFLFVLDLLILLCLYYNAESKSTSSNLPIIIFYFSSNFFFMSSDLVTNAMFYELQNIPFIYFLLKKHNVNFSLKDFLIDDKYEHNMSLKGNNQAIIFLLWYSLLSGLFLYVGYYNLYSTFMTNNIYLLKDNIQELSSIKSVYYGLLLIFLSGSIKVALVPFHIWLSKVHVEASTVGSVLLAGVALKSGYYIHILFSKSLHLVTYSGDVASNLNEIATTSYSLFILCYLLGSIIISISLFFQVDSKRWIALYSIAHMQNYYFFMIASNDRVLELSVYYGMLAHSFISAALFFIVGFIVDNTNNRNIIEVNSYLSSTTKTLFTIFIISNAGFPFLGLFVTEILNATLLINKYFWLTFIFIILSSSCLVSGLWISNKMTAYSGAIGEINESTVKDSILVVILVPLTIFSIAFGFQVILPISFLNYYQL